MSLGLRLSLAPHRFGSSGRPHSRPEFARQARSLLVEAA